MKVVGCVVVRMGSSRLPGKPLHVISGKPLLGHLLDRVSLARRLDGIVVATSVRPENDAIEAFCRSRGIACFRGGEDDVMGRMLGALESQGGQIGVEIFGDGPVIDPAVIDRLVGVFLDRNGGYDFVGNDLTTTWPPGQEAEVFSIAALRDAERRCTDTAVREHGTLFMRRNPSLYRLLNIDAPPELRRPDIGLEVDTPEDLEVMKAVLGHFAGRPDVGLAEVIAFMDAHPELSAVTRDVPRRWKQYRADV